MEHELAQSDGEWTVREDTVDSEELDSAQRAFDLMQGYLDTLRSAGTVSKGQIEAIVADAPDLLPESVPLASFTREPSETNYEVAVESIIGDMGRRVMKVLQAIWDFIKRIFAAIVQFFKGLRDRFMGVKRQAKQIEALNAALDKNKEIAVRTVVLSPSSERKAESAKRQLADIERQLQERFTNLHQAVLKNGQAIIDLRAHLLSLPRQIDYLQKFIENISDVINERTEILPAIFLPESVEQRAKSLNDVVAESILSMDTTERPTSPTMEEVLTYFRKEKRDLGELSAANLDVVRRAAERVANTMNRAPKFQGIMKREQDHRDLTTYMEFVRSFASSIMSVVNATQRAEQVQGDLIRLANNYLAKEYEIDLIYAHAATGEVSKKAVETYRELQQRLKK